MNTRKYRLPVNIKIRFGKDIVVLKNLLSEVFTKDGSRIYIKMRPDGRAQPMADVEDFSKHMHDRPVIISCKWDYN